MKGLNDVVKELQHLTEMLQSQGLGGAKPGVGGGSSGLVSSASSRAPRRAFRRAAPQALGPGGGARLPRARWATGSSRPRSSWRGGRPGRQDEAQDIARIIEHESSGNPNAINLWDDNAKAGHPSIGLMQTIQPTFDAYKLPGHDNIRNPVDNIVAARSLLGGQYGSVSNVPGIQGLNGGGGYVGY